MSADYRAMLPDERAKAARKTNDRLELLAAEKAKQCEHLTLEQVMVHWARVISGRGVCEFKSDDELEAEVMAIARVLGVKMRERSKVLVDACFDYGEPLQ
jgi:hypothetical protein